MKFSSPYRAEIARAALASEFENTLDRMAAAIPYPIDWRDGSAGPQMFVQKKMREIRPIFERLDEIHKMLTDKP